MQKLMNSRVNLLEIARQAMLAKGLSPDFPSKVQAQLNKLQAPMLDSSNERSDMTNKLWFSIDNDDSLDLDQLTYAERINDHLIRVYVAIADVDALVKKDTSLDRHALANTTSVYMPMIVFPMLPEKLSTNLTSLNPNEKRASIVVQMDVDESGRVVDYHLFQSYVFNYAKLAYNSVDVWLETGALPPEPIQRIKELASQIRLQDEVAQRLKKYRQSLGFLTWETYDPQPIIKEGQVVDLQEVKINRARELIENLMIAANTCITAFLQKNKCPIIKRVICHPKHWERIVQIAEKHKFPLPLNPDSRALENFLIKMRAADSLNMRDLFLVIKKLLGRGKYIVQAPTDKTSQHFGLTLAPYTHATAPNRRYSDLIVQRLIKARLVNQACPYSLSILQTMLQTCTEKEICADKAKRSVMKSVLALYLEDAIGKTFDAFLTGKGEKGNWIRLISTAIEGKLINGYQNIEVGDRLKVKLVSVNAEKGFLDFVQEKH
ncbi:Uncharacterized protein NEOC65_000051 [Neochlamydia sp. AcF65]|nr:Uncharacterized protein [Neochlamydia sp. AcF65]